MEMINLIELLQDANTIAITGHIRPDGDCIGSCLGLRKYLINAFPDKKVQVYLEKPTPIYSFLCGIDDIDSTYDAAEPYDVFITLDCSTIDRIGQAAPIYEKAKKTICIDHHVSNLGFGMFSEVDPKSSSTCELLTLLFEDKYIDDDVAESLYLGIAHDTGVFKYSNVTKRTFEVLSRLIEYKFDSSRIIDDTFYSKSYVQNQILGRALLESIMFMEGKCIASVITRRMMEFYGVAPTDLDGIVDQLRITKGVEVAIFLYESDVQEFKVSMRSNNEVDVAKIAAYFGGGGHIKAAGCTLNGTFYDVINNLSLHIEQQLKEKGII